MQRLVYLGGLILLVICTGKALALDCQSGADYYYRAKTETDQQMMIHWLNRSVKACPNYNAWYMLGLIYTNQNKTKHALTAFEQARTTAGSARTEALALARHGELLYRSGQWFPAQRALELAHRFHPDPVPAWLETSLKNVRVQTYRNLVPAEEIVNIFEIGTQVSLNGRFAVRPAVNLPVHFDFDRADLNPTGIRQVFELGIALMRIQNRHGAFLLVGHTDKRGTRTYNQKLSEDRAYSVKIELEKNFPTLIGRLNTRGRGETELLYDGDSETDHMLNRRVKVSIEE